MKIISYESYVTANFIVVEPSFIAKMTTLYESHSAIHDEISATVTMIYKYILTSYESSTVKYATSSVIFTLKSYDAVYEFHFDATLDTAFKTTAIIAS